MSAGTGVFSGRLWAFSRAALRSATVLTSFPEVQERLLAPEGMVAYSPAEGRGQKYLAEIKGCATSSEAIISPRSFRIREP